MGFDTKKVFASEVRCALESVAPADGSLRWSVHVETPPSIVGPDMYSFSGLFCGVGGWCLGLTRVGCSAHGGCHSPPLGSVPFPPPPPAIQEDCLARRE